MEKYEKRRCGITCAIVYSKSVPNTNTLHVIIQMSMDLIYESLGSPALKTWVICERVKNVATPNVTRAGAQSSLIQKPNQLVTTHIIEGR